MLDAGHEAIAEFILEASTRLAWMDEELARLHDESDKRALAAAREELVRMLAQICGESFWRIAKA